MCGATGEARARRGEGKGNPLETYVILEWSTDRVRASSLLPYAALERELQLFGDGVSFDAATFVVPRGLSFHDVATLVEEHLTYEPVSQPRAGGDGVQ